MKLSAAIGALAATALVSCGSGPGATAGTSANPSVGTVAQAGCGAAASAPAGLQPWVTGLAAPDDLFADGGAIDLGELSAGRVVRLTGSAAPVMLATVPTPEGITRVGTDLLVPTKQPIESLPSAPTESQRPSSS